VLQAAPGEGVPPGYDDIPVPHLGGTVGNPSPEDTGADDRDPPGGRKRRLLECEVQQLARVRLQRAAVAKASRRADSDGAYAAELAIGVGPGVAHLAQDLVLSEHSGVKPRRDLGEVSDSLDPTRLERGLAATGAAVVDLDPLAGGERHGGDGMDIEQIGDAGDPIGRQR
jgi:hypothetical protein